MQPALTHDNLILLLLKTSLPPKQGGLGYRLGLSVIYTGHHSDLGAGLRGHAGGGAVDVVTIPDVNNPGQNTHIYGSEPTKCGDSLALATRRFPSTITVYSLMRITSAAGQQKVFGGSSGMHGLNDTSPTGEPYHIASNTHSAILSGTSAARRFD